MAQVFGAMQAGIAAIVADVALGMAFSILESRDVLRILVLCACFAIVTLTDINIACIIIGCAILGAVRSVKSAKKEG